MANVRDDGRQVDTIQQEGVKVCSTCGNSFPRSSFAADRRAKDGLFSQCKACKKESQRRWSAANPDKERASALRHRAANPHSAKISKANFTAKMFGVLGELTVDDWLAVVEKYGDSCLACGTDDRIQLDHVIPLSIGGPNSRDNIQPLCARCNNSKGIKIEDYR